MSATHYNSCKAKLAKDNPSKAPLMSAVKKMDSQLLSNMEKLFNTAYLIAKEDYAFDDFPSLCALQQKNGIKFGNTYVNDKAAKQFVKYIAESMRSEIKEQFSSIDFFSMMADGSTDRATISSEIIYVYYLYEGDVRCTFIGLKECENECASGIKSTIETAVQEFIPDWKEKLVAVSFDGASVNMGPVSGIVKLMEDDCGDLATVHCVAHRLELALADALKCVRYVTNVEDTIKGIYSFYHNSAKRTRELKSLSEILDEKVLRPVGLHGIRWLQSRHRAVQVLIKNWHAVIIHMEQVVAAEKEKTECAKLRGYLKTLKCERFLNFLHLYEDISHILARLSETFQQKFLLLSDFFVKFESSKERLSKMISEDAKSLQEFKNAQSFQGTEVKYKDITLSRNDSNLRLFEEDRRKLITEIIESLNKRFYNMTNETIFANLKIFDPCSLYELKEDDENKVNNQLEELINNLPHNVRKNINKDALIEEFSDYKMWTKDKLNIPCKAAWQRLIAESKSNTSFYNIRKILEFVMVLPLSIAECERGFSQLNLIKTNTRNRLSLNLINDILLIKLYGPTLDNFNPQKAINLWYSDVTLGRVRRPDFKNLTS